LATLQGGKSNVTSKFVALLLLYVLTKGTFLIEEPGSVLLVPDKLLRREDRREKAVWAEFCGCGAMGCSELQAET
jgi:hypothetical protein